MSSVEYSADAINVLNRFHRCAKLVYVEGIDDKLFWDVLFEALGYKNYKIEAKDGCDELDKYITRLASEDLDIIIARDSDYIDISGKLSTHKRLINTYGYSIENTLLTPLAAHEIVKLWVKDNTIEIAKLISWLDDLLEQITPILLLDIANYHFNLYQETLGDNCTRYMKSQSCANIDSQKITTHYEQISSNFTTEQIEQAREILETTSREPYEVIRGHFLQSAILKFITKCISESGGNQKVSNDALYTTAIQQLKIMFNKDHEHYDHYKRNIESAFAA